MDRFFEINTPKDPHAAASYTIIKSNVEQGHILAIDWPEEGRRDVRKQGHTEGETEELFATDL